MADPTNPENPPTSAAPIPETPVTDTPVSESPVTENTVTESPVAETPADAFTAPTPAAVAPPAFDGPVVAGEPVGPVATAIVEAVTPPHDSTAADPFAPNAPVVETVEAAITSTVQAGRLASEIASKTAGDVIENADALHRQGLISGEEHEMWSALAKEQVAQAATDAAQGEQIGAVVLGLSQLRAEVAEFAGVTAQRLQAVDTLVSGRLSAAPVVTPGDPASVLAALGQANAALQALREAGAINAQLGTVLEGALAAVAGLAGGSVPSVQA